MGDCIVLFIIFGIDDYLLVNSNKIVNKFFKLSCKIKIFEFVLLCILVDCCGKIELFFCLW